MNLFSLAGHAALVTGSSRGIGKAIAEACLQAGAHVLWHGTRERPSDLPPDAPYLRVDLMSLGAPEELMQQAFAIDPQLDILVSNAGSFFDVPFLEMTAERWEQTISLNLRASYFLIQAFARRLVAERRPGSVVIITSTNGFQAERDSSAYDISKGGLVMQTRTLALALADYGIRVNAVAPGLIRTPLTEPWINTNHAMRRLYEKTIPLGYIGTAEECAGAAVFLASSAASYITGHILVVDGGLTICQIGRL